MHMSNSTTVALAEDGSKLWLRYPPIADSVKRDAAREALRQIVVASRSVTAANIRAELQTGLSDLLENEVPIAPDARDDGAIVVASLRHNAALLAELQWSDQLDLLGNEGFIIR